MLVSDPVLCYDNYMASPSACSLVVPNFVHVLVWPHEAIT